MRISDAQNMAETMIFDKNSYPAENAGNLPEIAVFADFHRTFS